MRWSEHTIAHVDDDWCEEVRPVDAPLGTILLVIILHRRVEHVELGDCEPTVILDVISFATDVAPAARCWVRAITEALAPHDILLPAPLVARKHRDGHWTPTDFGDASSCEVVAERVEVAHVGRVVDKLAHRGPLLEQLGRAAVADAPHRECKAAHALAGDAVVLEAARRAGERDDRTPWPFVWRTDAVHDLLCNPILLVGTRDILRRRELPDVESHPLLCERHFFVQARSFAESGEFSQLSMSSG